MSGRYRCHAVSRRVAESGCGNTMVGSSFASAWRCSVVEINIGNFPGRPKEDVFCVQGRKLCAVKSLRTRIRPQLKRRRRSGIYPYSFHLPVPPPFLPLLLSFRILIRQAIRRQNLLIISSSSSVPRPYRPATSRVAFRSNNVLPPTAPQHHGRNGNLRPQPCARYAQEIHRSSRFPARIGLHLIRLRYLWDYCCAVQRDSSAFCYCELSHFFSLPTQPPASTVGKSR